MSKAFTREATTGRGDRKIEARGPEGRELHHARGLCASQIGAEGRWTRFRAPRSETVAWAASTRPFGNADSSTEKKPCARSSAASASSSSAGDRRVVDPRTRSRTACSSAPPSPTADAGRAQHTVSIVGTDEVDPARGRVSWVSPIARALLRARGRRRGDISTPAGNNGLGSSRDSATRNEVRKPGTDYHIGTGRPRRSAQGKWWSVPRFYLAATFVKSRPDHGESCRSIYRAQGLDGPPGASGRRCAASCSSPRRSDPGQ